MVTQQIALKTARSFLYDCNTLGITFDKAFLCGPYATGKAHEGSDIDLLLISNKSTDNIFENLRQYASVNIKDPLLETHPYNCNEITEGDEFLSNIMKEAIEVN
jgi:predicted nucleotidyltransferase